MTDWLESYHSLSCAFPFSRFRSVAKSYFRKADGVLLLYDVTCEKSFLNVREWVNMIEIRSQNGGAEITLGIAAHLGKCCHSSSQ